MEVTPEKLALPLDKCKFRASALGTKPGTMRVSAKRLNP
jgi:hypothetical protein